MIDLRCQLLNDIFFSLLICSIRHISVNPEALDSGSHAVDSRFHVLDSSLFQWNLDSGFQSLVGCIHRIHKWRTRGKQLVPSRESEALEDKQKLQMKTFRELAESLARIPPKITLYGLLFKYNYVGCLLPLMFSSDFLFAIKRDAYIFKETG